MKGHAVVDPTGKRHTFQYENDFDQEIDANQLVVTTPHSGSGVVGAGTWGILPLIPSDGTVAANDEAYVETPNEFVGFEADKPWVAVALLQWNEANTDDAMIAFGLANAPGAGTIVDTTGIINTALTSVAAIYKTPNSTVWKCTAGGSAATQAANAKTSTMPACPGVAGAAGQWQWLEIIWTPISSTQGYVEFRVNDMPLCDANVEGNPKIRILVTITGSTTMAMFAGVKNGSANLETLNLDFWGLYGRRNRPTG